MPQVKGWKDRWSKIASEPTQEHAFAREEVRVRVRGRVCCDYDYCNYHSSLAHSQLRKARMKELQKFPRTPETQNEVRVLGLGFFTHIRIHIHIPQHIYIQVDEEHERYFKHLKSIDPDFTSCITHFIILDTPR